jgi:hypothetical protein
MEAFWYLVNALESASKCLQVLTGHESANRGRESADTKDCESANIGCESVLEAVRLL